MLALELDEVNDPLRGIYHNPPRVGVLYYRESGRVVYGVDNRR